MNTLRGKLSTRLLIPLAAVLLTGSLAACGSNSTSANTAANSGAANTGDTPSWCGTEPITVGLSVGNQGNAWVNTTVATYKAEAAKCPNITNVLTTNANGNPQDAISQFNSMVAQGAKAIVVENATGQALVPTIKSATERGTSVGVAASGFAPGSDVGKAFGVTWDTKAAGKAYAEWMAKALNGKGNVIFLGGAAGQPSFDAMWDGINEVFAQYPDIKMVPDHWVVTNEDQGQAQQATAAQLANGPIDGVITDYADTAFGAIQAFQAAGKPIPPIATNEQNRLGCEWVELSKSNPNFQLFAGDSIVLSSAQTLRMAVEQAQGLQTYEGDQAYDWKPYWDSTTQDKKPACDESYPQQALMSAGITADQQKEILGNN